MSYPYKLQLPLQFQVLLATTGALNSRIQWFLSFREPVMYIYTHTSFPLLSSDTLQLHKSKYLKQFFVQIQKLQKKCAKKRKCLELCLLKGCFKTQHPPPHTQELLLLPYLWLDPKHNSMLPLWLNILTSLRHSGILVCLLQFDPF